MIHWKQIGTMGRIDAIRQVWFSGCSTAQIAAHFEGATRNAVIGIYHRYGLSHLFDKPLVARSAINDAGRKSKKRRIARPAINFLAPSKPLPEPVEAPTEARLCGKPLTMLQAKECRWPVNNAVGDEVHLFCAIPADRMYCAHHIGRAYREAAR